MREPKVGDKIVVTVVDDVKVAPQITEVEYIEEGLGLLHVYPPIDGVDIEYDWLVRYPSGKADVASGEVDEWRYAVRKGDRLVVTKMNGKTVKPTVVTSVEDEELSGGILEISYHVLGDDVASDLLALNVRDMDLETGEYDEWHFAEDYVAEHFSGVPEGAEIIAIETDEPIADICSSFNECEPEYYVEKDSFGQSYSEFNAAHGGGKTLKDYTGVDITPETLGFVSDRDKTLGGITAESLAFKETVDNVNHPSHYNYGDIEVIDFIEQVADSYEDGSVAYMLGNTIKYVSRAPHKNGVEDLRKAAFYLNRAIERMEDAK